MATADEIERRIEELDAARHATRTAAAQQVGDLAQKRAAIAEQLDDLERQLGDVLVSAGEVMDIEEMARITDVPAGELTRWLTGRKPARTRRKKAAADAPISPAAARRKPSAARRPTADAVPTPPQPTPRFSMT